MSLEDEMVVGLMLVLLGASVGSNGSVALVCMKSGVKEAMLDDGDNMAAAEAMIGCVIRPIADKGGRHGGKMEVGGGGDDSSTTSESLCTNVARCTCSR